MINNNAVLDAEKDLFNSVLSQNMQKKYDSEIKEIIKVYANDDEIKNIMNVFELTADDFEIIYNHLLNSLDFYDLIYVQEIPCLFATAVILDLQCVIALANRIYHNAKINENRHQILLESADFSAHAFFLEHAVRQNIASVRHFCRNGICCRLRK